MKGSDISLMCKKQTTAEQQASSPPPNSSMKRDPMTSNRQPSGLNTHKYLADNSFLDASHSVIWLTFKAI